MAPPPTDDPVMDDVEALRFLFGEAKDHLGEVVGAIRETSDRAESVVRFNVLVLGLVVTAVSVLVRADRPVGVGAVEALQLGILVAVGSGFGALVVSTVFAVMSYLKRGVAVGLDAEDMVSAARRGLERRELVRGALEAYRDGIVRNEEIMSVAARRFRWSLLFLVAGIVLLGTAAMALLSVGGI